MRHLEALKKQDAALEALERMLRGNQHQVEGLTIAVGVGTGPCIAFEIMANTTNILEDLREGLKGTRAIRMILAKSEVRALEEYLTTLLRLTNEPAKHATECEPEF